MTKVWAIAIVSLRNAIRSKVVVSLAALLLVVIIGLPLSVKGDGTAAGYLRVTLSYTLGLAMVLLSITTLWSGSSAVAQEISDKTAQLIVTKPVHTWQWWLGKWLALNVMNAALIVLCGSAMYGILQWQLQTSDSSTIGHRDDVARILSAREVIRPTLPGIEEMTASIPDTGAMSEADRHALIQQLVYRMNTVMPGESRSWNLGPISGLKPDLTLSLVFRFSSSALGQTPVRGRWQIGTASEPALIERTLISSPRNINEIVFPADRRWHDEPVVIRYFNEADERIALVFYPDDGITLLVPRGEFAANYLRSLMVLWGKLAFLGAVGVTAGCLFSLPVASLVSLFFLLLIHMGSYVQQAAQQQQLITPSHQHQHAHDDHAQETEPVAKLHPAAEFGQSALRIIYRMLAFVVTPFSGDPVLDDLASGYLVSTSRTIRSIAILGGACSLALGILASILLRHRELALPAG